MANRRTNQFLHNFHRKPVLITARFKIAATDTAGNGVVTVAAPDVGTFGGPSTSAAGFGAGIAKVFGYTSATAATGNVCVSGNLAVQLQDNYKSFLGHTASFSGAVTGSAININDSTVMTVGQLYQIVTVGTSTTAQWVAAGVPVGVTPAVGVAFQAATTGVNGGTGTVKALASSNLTHIEVAGDPNLTINPNSQSSPTFSGGNGGWLFFNCFKTATLTQPTDGVIVNLNLLLAGN